MGANGVPSGIPLSEIEAYARMFGFDSLADRFDLMHYVRVCDQTWLKEIAKRSKDVGKHTKSRS